MFLFLGLTFTLGCSVRSPHPDWSKFGQVFQHSLTSGISVQLTALLYFSLLYFSARPCWILFCGFKGKSQIFKGNPYPDLWSSFLLQLFFTCYPAHKFQITQEPPRLSKSTVLLGSLLGSSSLCLQAEGQGPHLVRFVLLRSYTPSCTACCPMSQGSRFMYFAHFHS